MNKKSLRRVKSLGMQTQHHHIVSLWVGGPSMFSPIRKSWLNLFVNALGRGKSVELYCLGEPLSSGVQFGKWHRKCWRSGSMGTLFIWKLFSSTDVWPTQRPHHVPAKFSNHVHMCKAAHRFSEHFCTPS